VLEASDSTTGKHDTPTNYENEEEKNTEVFERDQRSVKILIIVANAIEAIGRDPECETEYDTSRAQFTQNAIEAIGMNLECETEYDTASVRREKFTQRVCSSSIVGPNLCVYSKETDTGVRVPDCPAGSHLLSQHGMDVAGQRLRGMPPLKEDGAEAGQSESWGRILLRPSSASNPGTIHTSELGATAVRRDGFIGRSETYR
jgi:hypothetical protein